MTLQIDHKPIQIQYRSSHYPEKAPLFLIHDGSGSIFSYLLLGDFERDVYGITDPLFEGDKSWEGGLHEMANLYISSVKSVVGRGPVFLGGWSLWGLVSLEMSHILRNQPELQILGLTMIDTPYTQEWRKLRHIMIKNEPKIPETTSVLIRQRVERRFEEAQKLVDAWNIPLWYNENPSKKYSYHSVNTPWHIIPWNGNGNEEQIDTIIDPSQADSTHNPSTSSPPPAVLLRATDPLAERLAESLIDVDMNRDSKLLGWEQYPYDFIRSVYDVSCDHYNIFDTDEKVCEAFGVATNPLW